MATDPISIQQLRNASDDAQDLQRIVNDDVPAVVDTRFGGPKPNYAKVLADSHARFQQFLLSSGYDVLGEYGPGLNISSLNHIFRKDGEFYRASKGLGLPYTTTGVWASESSKFVAVGDAALRQELAKAAGSGDSGSVMIGYGSSNVQDALDLVRKSDAGSALRYGADGNGTAESGVALANALVAAPSVFFPRTDAGYRFQGSRTITLTRDSVIDFGGNQITFGDTARITIASPVGVSGRTVTEAVQRGGGAIRLNSVAGIEVGDLLYVETTVAPSTEWVDTKKDCIRVKGFTGTDYVLLEEGLNFSYAPGDAGLQVMTYKPKRLTLRNPHLVISSDATPRVLIEIRGCQDVAIESPVITGPAPFNTATNIYRVGISFNRCFGAVATDSVFTRMSYPVILDGATRNVRATNITANACRHTVEAADWSSGLYVDGVDASDCNSAVSAHPSFNVHFSNVACRRETGLANLRTIGGSLQNGTIETLADDTAELPQFQSILLKPEYLYLYGDADFDAHYVKWRAPLRTTLPCFAVNFGRNVRVSHLTMPVMGMSLTSRGNITNLEIGPGMRIGGDGLPGKKWMQNAPRIVRPPLVAPRVIGGNPTLLLPFALVDAVGGYAEARGPVAIGTGNTPANTSFVIYLDTFADIEQPDEIVGYLTLHGSMRHNAAGRFSTRSKTWNFISSRSSPGSNSLFPLTPIQQSTLSGQANENLSLDISSATFATDSDGRQYVLVNIVMDSAGLSGRAFGLSYDLRLHRLL